jgi:DNA repair photolyase
LSRLVEAGIDVGVGMAPILPGLSDRPKLLADVVKAAREAGATSVWTSLLNLRPGTREHFLTALGREWPELVPRYERLYRGRAYLGRDEIDPVRHRVADLRDHYGIADRRRLRLLPVVQPAAEPEATQLDLTSAGFGEAAAPAWRIA